MLTQYRACLTGAHARGHSVRECLPVSVKAGACGIANFIREGLLGLTLLYPAVSELSRVHTTACGYFFEGGNSAIVGNLPKCGVASRNKRLKGGVIHASNLTGIRARGVIEHPAGNRPAPAVREGAGNVAHVSKGRGEGGCPQTCGWSGERREKTTRHAVGSSHTGGSVILGGEFRSRPRTGTACHLHARGVCQEAGKSGRGLGQGLASPKGTVEHAGRRAHFNCARARRMGHFFFIAFRGGEPDCVCNIHTRVTESVVVSRKEAAP